MGKRGRTPVDIRVLVRWEEEWWRAFSTLRHGRWYGLEPIVRAHLKDKEKRLDDVKRKTFITKSEVAEIQADLDRQRHELRRDRVRERIWRDLVAARTEAEIRQVCRRWGRLPHIRTARGARLDSRIRFRRLLRSADIDASTVPYEPVCDPRAVVRHAKAFLSITEHKRFPQSGRRNTDRSRIDYLAWGMAGVCANRKPATGIQILRTMKHDASGPLWNSQDRRCDCWRCERTHVERAIRASMKKRAARRGGHR